MNKVINLSNHDLVLATGLNARHGISGHTFELLEYWWYFWFHGVDVKVLCTAHKPEIMLSIAKERYSFADVELKALEDALVDGTSCMLAKLPVVVWVDGCDTYHKCSTSIARRNVALLCNNSERLDKMDVVLGDTRLYDVPCNHYVKKLLFKKFKRFECNVEDTAMLYCTIQARKLSQQYVDDLHQKFPKFKKFLLATNDDSLKTNEYTQILKTPCTDIFSKFNAYIYSPLKCKWDGAMPGVIDCSPRLPAECVYYNKEFIVDAPVNRGLNIRLNDCNDIEKITLNENDPLINYVL